MEKTEPQTGYLLSGEPISAEEARRLLADFYGERVNEVIAGLATGRYSCASVKGGVIYQVSKT